MLELGLALAILVLVDDAEGFVHVGVNDVIPARHGRPQGGGVKDFSPELCRGYLERLELIQPLLNPFSI